MEELKSFVMEFATTTAGKFPGLELSRVEFNQIKSATDKIGTEAAQTDRTCFDVFIPALNKTITICL